MNIQVPTFITRMLLLLVWCCGIFTMLYTPLLTQFFGERKSINLFIWPMILDPQVFKQFEQETGIKVYLNYYESNEELLSKLRATNGKGFDLIVPTDYMVELLIQEGLIKQLDKTRLPFITGIKPYFLGNYYDVHNDYSIPYYLSIFGLGVNKNYFGGQAPAGTWKLVFDKKVAMPHMSMVDNAREAIMLAAYYLYGTIEQLTPQQLENIKQLLIEQKQWIELYTSMRVEELLASGSCPLAVGTSADVFKAMREYNNIDFIVPQEGSFATIDSFVIPQATKKDDLVYQLINFLYRYEVVEHNSSKYGFCSPLIQTKLENKLCPDEAQFKQLHFFKNVLTSQQIQDLWIAVKAQ